MKEKTKIEKIRSTDSSFHWISVANPDEKTLEGFKRAYKFHPLDLEDCLSESQRPKIDDYDNYLFIVLHIPVRTGRRKQLKSCEINIFIGPTYLITVHDDNNTIEKLFEGCKKKRKTKDDYLSNGPGYLLYRIISDLFETGFPMVDDISRQINELEVDVFDSDYSRDRLKEILLVKKDIINFRRIIMPQRAIIAQLEHKNKKFLPENLNVYFDDVVDKIEKMWNNLENLQELISSLHSTNESIISHNTNNTIKTLTLFSVIMLPLTFITGFYGMNVNGLPFAASELSVEIVTGIIFLVVLAMIGYFRFKKWV